MPNVYLVEHAPLVLTSKKQNREYSACYDSMCRQISRLVATEGVLQGILVIGALRRWNAAKFIRIELHFSQIESVASDGV